MADIKLTYFPLTGKGELIRVILAYAGVKFEDERISFEEFAAMKQDTSKLPYGQLPVLHYNGVLMAQSLSIARFLATEYGLAGRNNLERAQIDEIVDAIWDIRGGASKVLYAPSPEEKEEGMKKFLPMIDTGFARLETRLASRGGQFFVGNTVSWAEFMLFTFLDMLTDRMGMDVDMSKFPKLDNLNKRVGEMPNIKKWMDTRPGKQ